MKMTTSYIGRLRNGGGGEMGATLTWMVLGWSSGAYNNGNVREDHGSVLVGGLYINIGVRQMLRQCIEIFWICWTASAKIFSDHAVHGWRSGCLSRFWVPGVRFDTK